ncbi:MAG: DNA polymerase III subunit gamma/tau [Bacteroidota bacterium]
MNNFVVSSRKYRPHLFSQIRGQEHVVGTLRNAIKTGQIAQAFLFCGLKGSGKTTCARILAKTINCQKITPEGDPCEVCTNCYQFQTQKSLNIYELDAASHNSAEDMRRIVEQMRFHPPEGKKTVIIIDEAHMLSNAALNVLLKPLEDTPPHIVFILVTTEKHKIIPTIISRCQVFDFHSIKQKDIIEELNKIAKKEKINVELPVFELISEKSGGSMRDALSMFDLLATSQVDQQITYQRALQQFHLVDESLYFDITDAVDQGNIEEAFLIYDRVMRLGLHGQQFLTGWSQHLRNLLVAKSHTTISLLNVVSHLQNQYQKFARVNDKAFLYKLLTMLHEASIHYRATYSPRLYIELVLVKAVQINHTQIVDKQPVKQFHQATTPLVSPAKLSTKESVPEHEVAESAAVYTANSGKYLNNDNVTLKKNNQAISAAPISQATPSLQKLSRKIQEASLSPPSHHNISKPASDHSSNSVLVKEQVMNHWKNYAKKLKKEKNKAVTLFSLPIVIKDSSIIIQVYNPLHEKELLSIQKDLTLYCREQLANPKLVIKAELTNPSSTGSTKSSITGGEKLRKLVTDNAVIASLKQKLDLIIS